MYFHTKKRKKYGTRKKWRNRIFALTADVLLAALLVYGIYNVNYLIPQKGISAQVMFQNQSSEAGKTTVSTGDQSQNTQNNIQSFPDSSQNIQLNSTDMETRTQTLQALADKIANGLQTTTVSLDTQDWHQKFADKFTDQIVSTDTTYSSPDLCIELTYGSYKTDRVDHSENGNHEKYGTNVSYVLADIYVSDITCLQTCFAQNIYGIGYSEKLTDMSDRMQSVLSVNGDSYSNSRHKDNGTIIRNGVIYRAQSTDMETCVLNWDGTMDIYSPSELNTQTLIDKGAYQSWIFGPSLLDANGKAKTSFQTWAYITESHPRTAIGYFEPGHYCLLTVDGRQDASRGMFLDEMAALFEQLGCKSAYNLDGGHCSFMTFQGQVANKPYKPQHTVQDGIFITKGLL